MVIRRLRAWLAAAALCGLLSPGDAVADPEGDAAATARKLFEEGIALTKSGAWEKACARFDASVLLHPNPSTLVQIGKCREREGKLVPAFDAYRRAVKLAEERRAGEPESRRKAREDVAREALTAVTRRIGLLRIAVTPAPAGLRVTRDGAEIAPGALGEPIPAEPGSHEIVVEAPGHENQRRTIDVAAGATLEVAISLVPAALGAETAPPSVALAATTPLPAITAPATVEPTPRIPSSPPSGGGPAWRQIASGGLIGAGSAGLLTAGGLGIATLLRVGESNDHCDATNACEPEGLRLRAEARDLQTAGFVVAGVSAALVIAGVVVLVTAPSRDPRRGGGALSVGLAASVGGAGGHATISGRF